MSTNIKKQKQSSMKTRRFINNSIVHVVLTILSVIWLFPVFWVIMTSLRVEDNGTGSYTKETDTVTVSTDDYARYADGDFTI